MPVQAQTVADYTVSSNSFILYDFNRVFAVLEFAAAPPSTLVAVAHFETSPSDSLDTQYAMLLDITATIPISAGARIVINMID